MGAKQLIEAALMAKENFDTTSSAMAQATAALQQAKADLDDANQACHDFFTQNGPRLYVDESTDPESYFVCSAVEPDSWSMTPIEIAA